MNSIRTCLLMLGLLWNALHGQTQTVKEKYYLSGTDNEHTVDWDFWVTGGRKAGRWEKIAVPSHWEQQGFGAYNYGRDYVTYGKNFRFHDEKGLYKHRFQVPKAWKGKKITIVFEGSMTDTEVKINNQTVGAVHQGAFYRFQYDISEHLLFDRENLLEVTVSKMSANPSVNNAERLADYWILSGIYRPVYLEATPATHISWTAIDAKADGTFASNVYLAGIVEEAMLQVDIKDNSGKIVATTSVPVQANDSLKNVALKMDNPQCWTAETPHLYHAVFSLTRKRRTVYQTKERFGFRTVEVRKGDGIYVNGAKIKMKGVNRHVWWPETGRSVNSKLDLQDVKLIKEMNMNAVRCSHYPPDKSFLEICDSLGLYVLDELAGWQKAYATPVGKKLVKEMVIRDVNHPSIILWSNGNEGGHNKELIAEYSRYDLSARTVIHAHHRPGNAINGIDCNHYEDYYSTKKILEGPLIYMPTEFLHAQDDGGAAAGLSDIWELHWNAKLGAGGFIWDFADEGIVRTDFNGVIDVNKVNAPDGILGPHREKEGSFYAIREIFSPVHIAMKKLPEEFDGKIAVENRYHHSDLKNCRFYYKLVNYKRPYDQQTGLDSAFTADVKSPNLAPTAKGFLDLQLPATWKSYDALLLTAVDQHGLEIYTWSWRIKNNAAILQAILPVKTASKVLFDEDTANYNLSANGIKASFAKQTGLLADLSNDYSMKLAFNNGPVLVNGQSQLLSAKPFSDGDKRGVTFVYAGNLHEIRWTMHPDGWLQLDYSYAHPDTVAFAGVSFDFPENYAITAKWLGNGPYRVWKNRLQGVTLNTWENMYNDSKAGIGPWTFPEFKGYFADVSWMQFNTTQGKFLVATAQDDLYIRLFDFYGISGPKGYPALPTGNISFLDAIPPIGTKLAMGINSKAAVNGPAGELNLPQQAVNRTLFFYFGLPKEEQENTQFIMPKENILTD
ncbi:glycoside hydrolase family 2 TIM barrel-domain containing protein [Sphingobacterium oryzagri]|uniref:Beta-galactosidase n=1 Tax=Sphingobacterium oryzagri TaxID=3025669 RepID=A0ABY7WI77_9SPHI|nr:glycoside hydrolase family 2 TIM barrel-domain containing protein [Sphingobacterium sp. KACC 22765]WDF68289.1 glycoside hydrolase family 2 TIM barrel-domain containing protein [Sphingobacterium sp. KACC 22765]